MQLTEVKKLKVAELRAKLKELGLDAKGLKAELVVRLLSAFEAGLCVPESSNISHESGRELPDCGEEEARTQDDDSLTPAMETEIPVPPLTEAGGLRDSVHEGDVAGTANLLTAGEGLPVPMSTFPEDATPHSPASAHTGTQSEAELEMSPSHLQETCVVSSLCSETLVNTGFTFQVLPELHSARRPLEAEQHNATQESVEQAQTNETFEVEPQNATPTTVEESQSEVHIPVVSTKAALTQEAKEETLASRSAPQNTANIDSPTAPHQSTVITSQVSVCSIDPGFQDTGLVETSRGRAFYEFKKEIQYKRAQLLRLHQDYEEEENDWEVRLDSYTCDLHFQVGSRGSRGQPRFIQQFPFLWSGCRLTYGAHQGRVGFEVRFERKLLAPWKEADPEPHGLRVGWSVDNSSLQLGEDDLSYGYDGRGRKVIGGKEEEFGESFSENDTIGCYASLSDEAVELSFYKNGCPMGTAFQLGPLGGHVLYPHVLCKNCSVTLNLDPTAPPWYPCPPGYTPLHALPIGQMTRAPLPPASKKDCEVVMMVGLPGAGKTHWAQTHMKQHPEKRYVMLGTTTILACMRGKLQKELRLQQASECLTELIKVAHQVPHNYILDQPNVYPSARQHKLLQFQSFRRRAVVVFPPNEEWKKRLQEHQREEGDEIPKTSLLKAKVSFTLPELGELLDEVQYVELDQKEAQALLESYKEEARSMLPPVPPKKRRKHRVRHNKSLISGPPRHDHGHHRGHGWNPIWPNQQPYAHHQLNWAPQPRYQYGRLHGDQGYVHNYNPDPYRDYYSQWNQGYQDQGFYGNRNYTYSSYQGYW